MVTINPITFNQPVLDAVMVYGIPFGTSGAAWQFLE